MNHICKSTYLKLFSDVPAVSEHDRSLGISLPTLLSDVDGHSFGWKGQGINSDGLMGVDQRPFIPCHHEMYEDEDVEPCQLVAHAEPWSSSKRYEHIRRDGLLKPARVKPLWLRKVLGIIMCPICCPQNLTLINFFRGDKYEESVQFVDFFLLV